MNKKKLGTTLASLALVGAIGVGATLAYLTDQSDGVKNTFTLSNNVGIVLDEKNVDGEQGNPKRDTTNEYKNMIPNVEREKDPTVTLTNTDLNQYAFIAVKESANVEITDFSRNWKLVEQDDTKGYKYYVYFDGTVGSEDYIVTAADDTVQDDIDKGYSLGIQLPAFFEHVKVQQGISSGTELQPIYLAAAAIQADGIESVEDGEGNVTKEAYKVAFDEVKSGLTKTLDDVINSNDQG